MLSTSRAAPLQHMALELEARWDRVARWPRARGDTVPRIVRHLAVVLAPVGFVVRPAGDAALSSDLDRRHVALVVWNRASRLAAIVALAESAQASARAHLVIDCSSQRRAVGAPPVRSCSALHRARATLRRLAADSGWAAPAAAAALAMDARWWPDRLNRSGQAAAAYFRRVGRREEALAIVSASTIRRGPSSSPARQAVQGESSMLLLPAMPRLLEAVTDAEDELAALTNAGRWARSEAGADVVAFIDAAGARVVQATGVRGYALRDDERLAAREAPDLRRIEHAEGVTYVAATRYAGLTQGAVVVRGPVARTETLDECARLLAVVTAPALRGVTAAIVDSRADRVPEIVGRSPGASALREAVVRAAATPFAVLIEGESGTGKELVARAIHRLSARRDRRFAALNCAALPDELADAELFGHVRGAFTGAIAARTGLFEEAHGGTLFLDEVAELSARTQARLLRVIQEREVRRLGEAATRTVDTRLVAASNRPLRGLVASGSFRHDLLFRLAVVRIAIAPLRERAEDIASLALAFWPRVREEAGKRAQLGPDALVAMAAYSWPGNVRELQNVLARLAVSAPERGRVGGRHVEMVLADQSLQAPPRRESLERARRSHERRIVAAALSRHGGRRSAAARELGMSRQGLMKAMRRLTLGDDRQPTGVA